jgi:glyoxylate/hydroxypyruvate reductase A
VIAPQAFIDEQPHLQALFNIGAGVAQTLRFFEFPVLGWSRSPKNLADVRCYAGAAQFDDFLAASRVLVNLLPLPPARRAFFLATPPTHPHPPHVRPHAAR